MPHAGAELGCNQFVRILLLLIAASGAGVIELSMAASPAQTTTTLVPAPDPVTFGAPIVLTANVNSTSATGEITFYDGVTVLGTASVSAGHAGLSVALNVTGARQLYAHYSGDADFAGSTSTIVIQNVRSVPEFGFAYSSVNVGVSPNAAAVGDFNGDGKADLVAVGTGNIIAVALGNGDGTFGAPITTLGPAASAVYSFAAVSDFDGDGKLDLALANPGDNSINVLFGNGDGAFGGAAILTTGASSITVADFNGDGIPDLAVVHTNTNSVGILLGNGGRTFTALGENTPDGGVHDIFTIAGRADSPHGYSISHPDFSDADNIIFRIPTPVFGAGLIEAITDTTIKNNLASDPQGARRTSASRVTSTPAPMTEPSPAFGWKAQNKSLLIFAGEAYNVEMGVTNENFPTEREEGPNCATNATPESASGFNTGNTVPADIIAFMGFMKFLDQPTPSCTGPLCSISIQNGEKLFSSTGYATCHTPTLTTGDSATAARRHKNANLFSDLAVHHMGSGLADGITQGSAGPDEFRSAPLWGLGQRAFFLHDADQRFAASDPGALQL